MSRVALLSIRYFLFGLLVVSDAVLCSVGVWNLSLAQAAGSTPQVDVYVIILGALGLLAMLPLLFVDALWKYALTGRVWFECAWVGLQSVLHLAGAAAVTVLLPNIMCKDDVRSALDSCTSTRVLQGFSWLCTLFLFLYLVVLFSSALVHYKLDDTIWHASVRRYDWYRHEKIPASPTIPQLPKLRTSLVAPQPRRPVMLSTQSALDARYTVEHLSPNATSLFSHERPVPPVPAAPPAQSVMQETRQLELSNELSMPSLYPKHLASAWTFPQSSSTSLSPPKPTISRSQPGLSSSSSSVPVHTEIQHALSLPRDEPPPLGQWPRKNIMKRPAPPPKTPPKRTTPRKPPPSAFTLVPQTPPSPTPASASASLSPALVTPPVRRSIDSDRSFDSVQSSPGTRLGVRPSGPRRRSSDLRRPAPLDLSRLSNGRT